MSMHAAEASARGELRFAVITEPVPPSYEGIPQLESQHKKPVKAGALFGIRFHAVVGKLLEGLENEEYEIWKDGLYSDQPTIIQRWVEASESAAPIIRDMTEPAEGYVGNRITEGSFPIAAVAIQSSKDVKKNVLEEQRGGKGRAGRLENILTNNPGFMLPYGNDALFAKLMAKLPKRFPYTREELQEHLDNMRVFQLASTRRVLFPPGLRFDLMTVECPDHDEDAIRAMGTFSEVLRSGIGFDFDKLKDRVPYVYDPGTDDEKRAMVIPIEALYEAFSMIQEGRIRPKLWEYKTVSRLHGGIGDGDLAELFSDDHLASADKKAPESRLMRGHLKNLASSRYSLRAWVSYVIKEFDRDPNHAEDPHLDVDAIMDKIECSLLIADCDLRDPSTRPKEDNGIPLKTRDGIEYKTEPPIETVGVPNKITIIEKPLSKELAKRYGEAWERRVHIAYLMGRFAVDKATKNPKSSKAKASQAFTPREFYS